MFKKRAVYLLIFGAFIFYLVLFFFGRSSSEARRTVKVVPVSSVGRGVDIPPIDFDSASYYRPILEYNLFRPLGWSPPVRVEPYRLLGTILPKDDSTPSKAIFQTTAGKKTYIVSIGETLDASTEVVDISGKSVVLSTEGRERTLELNTGIWLNPSVRSSVVRPRRSVPGRVVSSPARSSASLRREPPRVRDKLSAWETVEGEVIRIGDARLKNPAKWRLRRRFPDSKLD